ncbi:hypothetical protein WJX77_010338 [Trebouxia sp. C0004]
MKPSSNPEKGQRSIASFFFKPKAGPTPKNGQTKQQQRVLGEKQAAQGPPLAATSKRQRVSTPESHRQQDAVPRHMSSSPALHTQAPKDSAVRLQAAASSNAQPAHVPQAPSMQPASAARESHPTQAPARVEQRHQRFQQKLVIGAGNKPEGHSKSMPAVTKPKYTPLELQIVDLKDRHPGVLLIVEVGYKMRFFGEDADTASKECNIFAYPDHNFLTASIPVPRLHVYVRRLVEAGYKVGVVRQMETAAIKASGSSKYTPFTRKLTAVYTRATLEAGDKEHVGEGSVSERADASWSNQELSHYLVCVVEAEASHAATASQESPAQAAQADVHIGVVAVEISTGDVLYGQFRDGLLRGELEACLMFAPPSELLVAQPISSPSQKLLGSYVTQSRGLRSQSVARSKYSQGGGLAAVTEFYGAAGGSEESAALQAVMQLPEVVVQALAHALDYVRPLHMEAVLRYGASFKPFHDAHQMSLSPNALRQLEVLRNNDDGGERGSLLWLMDHTKTPFGGRLLRNWVAHPLTDRRRINERLDAVEEMVAAGSTVEQGDSGGPLMALPSLLKGLPDMERGITRIFHRTANPAEFVQVLQALVNIAPKLGVQVAVNLEEGSFSNDGNAMGVKSALLSRLMQTAAAAQVANAAHDMLSMIDIGAAQLNDKINLFQNEVKFPEVFRCQRDVTAAQSNLQQILVAMRKVLHLPRLEYVSIQNQADFLIEVPVQVTDVPKGWEKVCSTKKMNRFHPPEVKQGLQQLEIAKEHLQAAALAAWEAFLGEFALHYAPFRGAVMALASLDAIHSLAALACNTGYVRPQFVDEDQATQLRIVQGRHPVLDVALDTPVVPNNTDLSGRGPCALVITGPNMGGKSCYIRQAALIAIMAQVGSLVPAESAELHVLDAVHTRMGASDNLAMGSSTFLEELSETSTILACATRRSLVIVDELGRGTSTHDGLAIALATLQHLVAQIGCLTLFVTHYPKVAALQQQNPGSIESVHMSYLANQADTTASGSSQTAPAVPQITFLYKLVPGVADRSFGLNVARMAHLPTRVVDRAAEQAEHLEEITVHRARHRSEDVLPSTAGGRPASITKPIISIYVCQVHLGTLIKACFAWKWYH